MNETKTWWMSRAVWGGVVSAAAGIAALFGVAIDDTAQSVIVEVGLSLAAAIGGAVAVYGRMRATTLVK